jgi:hypothetical protein
MSSRGVAVVVYERVVVAKERRRKKARTMTVVFMVVPVGVCLCRVNV